MIISKHRSLIMTPGLRGSMRKFRNLRPDELHQVHLGCRIDVGLMGWWNLHVLIKVYPSRNIWNWWTIRIWSVGDRSVGCRSMDAAWQQKSALCWAHGAPCLQESTERRKEMDMVCECLWSFWAEVLLVWSPFILGRIFVFLAQVGVKSFHVEVGNTSPKKGWDSPNPLGGFGLGALEFPGIILKGKGSVYLLGGVGPQSTRFTQVAYRTPTKTFRWNGHAWYLGRNFGEQITSRWKKTSCQKRSQLRKKQGNTLYRLVEAGV